MPAHPSGVLHAGPSPVWLPEPDDVNELMPSLWSKNTVKKDGVLTVCGHSVQDLAQTFGSPVFVFDVDDFQTRARDFAESFAREFAANGMTARGYYAGKAFLCTAVARWATEAGLGVDTCTLGEMLTARAAGVDPGHVGLHGNNKSDAELEMAVSWGIGRIVVDSLEEIPRIERIAERFGMTAPVMVRVTVGVEAHTHDFIATAHEDQKFGLSLASGQALEACKKVLKSPHLDLVGLHSHIGSQIFDAEGFILAATRVIRLRAALQRDFDAAVAEVDLGGGFGIRYTSQDTPSSFADMARKLARAVVRACEDEDTDLPHVSFEPGRAIVGPSAFTLYEVGTIKPVHTENGVRTYVSIDGGMSDNARTALYDADYSCTLANRRSDAEPIVVRVVGKHCESGDIVVRDEYLPSDVSAGDLIAVPDTGAYCKPLASNYNLVPRPGVLAVEEGRDPYWIVQPETYSDLFATDPGFDPALLEGDV